MELKKNKKYDLDRRRPAFFGIGLIVAISLVVTAFEWRTEIDPIITPEPEIEPVRLIHVQVTEIKNPPKPLSKKRKAIQKVEVKNELVKAADDAKEELKKAPDFEPEDEPYIEPEPIEVAEELPVNFAEVMPSYEGGMQAFYEFISDNIKYPRQAQRMGIEGKVFVRFVVEKDGSLTNIEVVKGVEAGCKEEALRVMKMVEGFKPGKQGDVRVRVQMVIPISFKLQ